MVLITSCCQVSHARGTEDSGTTFRNQHETAIPGTNLELQDHSQPSNDDSVSKVESVSDSSKSDSASSSTPSCTETENENTEDPSNNHLVSSSDYDVYLSVDRLMHKAWYEQEGKDSSSDEEDDGLGNGVNRYLM